jgi:hypothetical protein
MAKNKPLKPSRPLLEVSPAQHGALKDAAAKAGMPLKEFVGSLLANGLLRLQAGTLVITPPTPARAVDAP